MMLALRPFSHIRNIRGKHPRQKIPLMNLIGDVLPGMLHQIIGATCNDVLTASYSIKEDSRLSQLYGEHLGKFRKMYIAFTHNFLLSGAWESNPALTATLDWLAPVRTAAMLTPANAQYSMRGNA